LSAREGASSARVRRQGANVNTGAVWLALGVGVLAAVGIGLGLGYAGSQDRIAGGVRIAGVDVGGLTKYQAVARLRAHAARLQSVPVSFVAGPRRFAIRPEQLGVTAAWGQAVEQAIERGSGFAVVRGYKRLRLRFDPVTIEPSARAYDAAVNYEVGVLADKIDLPHVQARLVRRGLAVRVFGGRTGRLLDRPAAARAIVDALAGFSRRPVELPVRTDPPTVTVADLAPVRRLARRAVSAPVTLARGAAAVGITRWQLAGMLQLPAGGAGKLAIGGPAANKFFARLDHRVSKPAVDARFAVDGSHVTILPSQTGTAIDVPRTVASVLAAAERRHRRVAYLAETVVRPTRTTAQASAMGITGIVGSYETYFGGIANRIHNVELVAHLVDNKLIAPGATFSFNGTTGARTAEKGFVDAPVIINGELQTALGGGVCQVSTTVFNAAYEAGLPITARTNHALYISHYPLGRDATVDYPDVDLKFVNDTKHWLLLRTFVTSSSLVVNLYGAPQHRRVETETAPLRVVSSAPVEVTVDRSLSPGETVVDDPGAPATSTWVRRKVYSASGKLLYDSTWYSSYVASPELERVGPKPVKKPPAKKPPVKKRPVEEPIPPAIGLTPELSPSAPTLH
jgi:vancomycin resistance protein YoaR